MLSWIFDLSYVYSIDCQPIPKVLPCLARETKRGPQQIKSIRLQTVKKVSLLLTLWVGVKPPLWVVPKTWQVALVEAKTRLRRPWMKTTPSTSTTIKSLESPKTRSLSFWPSSTTARIGLSSENSTNVPWICCKRHTASWTSSISNHAAGISFICSWCFTIWRCVIKRCRC